MDYIKEIITDEEALDGRCSEIDPKKQGKLLQEIILSLKSTMREKNVVSLTAPQIGYKNRVFCVKFGENDIRTFVNPVMTEVDGLILNRETCSSIVGKEYIIPRYRSLVLIYQTPLGAIETKKVSGKTGMVIQHCVDHFDGLLISQNGLEVLDGFDDMSDKEKDEILKLYLESLDIKLKQLTKEIDEDAELKQIKDATDFMGKVSSGDVEIDPYTTEELNKMKEAYDASEEENK